MTTPALGAMFDRDRAPEALRPFAQDVERLGLAELWVVEDCFWTGAIASAAHALSATTTLQVGIGIAPAPLRNPALLAMELGALARYHPGRVIGGIGHGVDRWMRQVGAEVASPLTLLDEVTTTTRALLHGERVTLAGRFINVDGVRLVHPPAAAPPIVLGVRRERSLELSGRVADGTIFDEGTTPEAVASGRKHIDRGCAAAGRALEDHRIVVFAYLSVDDDADRARQLIQPIADALAAKNDEFGRPSGPGVVIAGTRRDCHATIRQFVDAGADSVVLRPIGEDPTQQLAQLLNPTDR